MFNWAIRRKSIDNYWNMCSENLTELQEDPIIETQLKHYTMVVFQKGSKIY